MLYPSELRARKDAEKKLQESVLILPRRIQAAKAKELAAASVGGECAGYVGHESSFRSGLF